MCLIALIEYGIYGFFQPLNVQQYDAIRHQASDIHAYAPDARVLTTYYSGKSISCYIYIQIASTIF